MKKTIKLIIAMMSIIFVVACSSSTKSDSPDKIGAIAELPDVEIISVTKETDMAPHTKVVGVIGGKINFELLLPEDWNGKFVMGGGAGFVGSVINVAITYGAVEKGYATVGTDTGHKGHPLDGSWAYNDMEALVNFGHLGVHRTAVTAKAIIQNYYQKEISYSYFFGCSRGGGQALMEAQRYPDDFDGIVAGAPAYNWTHGLGASMVHNMKFMYPDPNDLNEPKINPKDLELVERTYLELYDELDGIKDGIIKDPSVIEFNLDILLCDGEQIEDCLSAEKIEVLKAIYNGAYDECGNRLYYGFPIGGETDPGGWFMWLTGGFNYIEDVSEFQSGVSSDHEAPHVPNAQFGFGLDVMKYMIFHDSSWTYENYNFKNFEKDSKLVAGTLNADNPDLSAFRKNGGKLLMYSGWSDLAISAYGTIGYYNDVIAFDSTAKEDVKLFMMPGVLHCSGGKGAWFVNWIDEIDKWVAAEETLEQLTVYSLNEQNQPDGSSLLCPYPNVPTFDVNGDARDAKSFSCSD